MTEEEWLECTEPQKMLLLIQGKEHDRKLRLFLVACCRRVRHLLPDDHLREAIEIAERFADGLASKRERNAAFRKVYAAMSTAFATAHSMARRNENGEIVDEGSPELDMALALSCVAITTSDSIHWRDARHYGHAHTPAGGAANAALALSGWRRVDTDEETLSSQAAEQVVQQHLLRCIFGNPFRPSTINPNWLTLTITNLATAAYEQRALPSGELDTTRLAIVAVALKDAGCDNEEILGHLRSPGPHVRGCHVLDFLLGKE